MRGLHDPLKARPSSLFILFGWISNCLPFKSVCGFRYCREDSGVLEINEVVMVEAMFCHC